MGPSDVRRRRGRGLAAAVLYVLAALAVGTVLWVLQPLPAPFESGSVALRALALTIGTALGGWIVFETVRNAGDPSASRR